MINLIKAQGIVKKFGNFCALNGFDMHVPKGSIYGLIGPNGAGKTTIINHLTGAYIPDSGSVTIDGEPILNNTALKQRVLCISDEGYQFGGYSTKDMADFYRSIYKNFNVDRYKTLGEMLEIDEKQQIRRLSKGMKKQVHFRLALSCMPDVLILDEPLDGLDPVMRKQIVNVVISDVASRDMTVLVSSHNLRELEDICDHVGIIHKGKMVMEKPIFDLKGSICKVQLAFEGGELPEGLEDNLEVLHSSRLGSVHTLIIRADAEKVTEIIKGYHPLVFDRVNLTLEEIFIYEMGGLGYDFKNIII